MTMELAALRCRIDALTAEMSASAARGDWPKAGECGELRQDLLETLFAVTDDKAEERALVRRIVQSDLQLRSLADESRKAVSDELAIRRQRREAVDCYRDVASPATRSSV